MVAALLRHHLREAGVAVPVESAGTLGWNGRPAADHAVEVLAERGIHVGAHHSRRLERQLIDAADLIVAMARNHAWAVAAHDAGAAARTFLLDELVRLGERAGPRGSEPLQAWVAALDSLRPPSRLGRASEEVPDPAGESIDVYRATADRAERAVRRLRTLL